MISFDIINDYGPNLFYKSDIVSTLIESILVDENKQGVLSNDSFRMFSGLNDKERKTLSFLLASEALIFGYYAWMNIPKMILGPPKPQS